MRFVFSRGENGYKLYASAKMMVFMAQNETAHATDDVGGDDAEFDPIGTLTLIGIYFVILVLSWVFIYYIEFLGRDLTVVG